LNYNQSIFWFLFAVVYALYWRLGHKGQNRLLLIASYIFYGFWDYRFLFLILISTVIDFIGGLGVAGVRLTRSHLLRLGSVIVGASVLLCSGVDYQALLQGILAHDWSGVRAALPHRLSDFRIPFATVGVALAYGAALPFLYGLPTAARRKAFLVVSMVANLGILGFFKYCDFFIANLHALLVAIGVTSAPWSVLGIILPAGISFYTFQAMSYTIDIYRGQTEPTDSFLDFALFVCFFPHLVAGPIMRAHTLLPQVVHPRSRRARDLEEGFFLILVGMFKKIVVSDNMAPIADAVFTRLGQGDAHGMTGAEVLVGLYAFAFQIYGDFSGYSAIARGISKWIGFDLVVNFHLPYIATSPSDFWRRWHISLSSWLRDYLYIPLGGNRQGVIGEYRNLILTMLLGGLWHGARWTFVAWGLYHGVILCLFRIVGLRDPEPQQRARWLVRVVVMFHLTCLGWLLFRADTFGSVVRALEAIATNFHFTAATWTAAALIAFYAGVLFVVELILDGENQLQRLLRGPLLWQTCCYAYLGLMLLFFHAQRAHEFIYFQF